MNDEELDQAVHALSRAESPPVDLWPEIERSIRPARNRWVLPLGLVSALAAGMLLWNQVSHAPPVEPATLAFGGVVLDAAGDGSAVDAAPEPEVDPVEQALAEAASDLLAAYSQRRTLLDEELLAVFDDNLAVVDQAIERSRAALRTSPEDEHLHRVLRQAYDHKLELLRAATDVGSPQ